MAPVVCIDDGKRDEADSLRANFEMKDSPVTCDRGKGAAALPGPA
jgi:hypothetical protein